MSTSFYAGPPEDPPLDASFARVGLVLGRSRAMENVATLLRQVALYPSTTVLLQSESGTGKDVVARAIHLLSSRANREFFPINCAAIPETLLETELFGVEAGAFTDARTTREGYLSRANGGTLFLDEIGSMSLFLQAKLLRFLETRSFRRVGGTRELQVDLRVISATNMDLQTAVARKTFRDDLFYRLKVVTIYLPPLRERPEDIEPLVEHFLRVQQIEGTKEPLCLSPQALELLMRFDWPGNVRQLRSAIQHAQIFCDPPEILPKDLPGEIRKAGHSDAQRLQELYEQIHLPQEGLDLQTFLGGLERRLVQEALERCNGNQVQAAALLHISRYQLRYKLNS